MQSNIHNSSDFPPELYVKPLALVGVSGLDTLNNATHKAIWETFSNNRRPDRAPVLFKLIGNAHEFPVVKPKRNSYDWYLPKGILKRNWMNKHLYEIPAVIVIFYELDWNNPHWNEKMIECASRVQSMRAALDGRTTRITVVLIQNTLPLPPGEDILASDRAVALCASCELNATSLYVLPHGDHLQGYAVRLENAFYEFAQNYYHAEIKIIRNHKELLNKTSHQSLLVRHQFKMGFLYELKQDMHTAHKHYTHAYNNLLEIRIVDTNALEIRTVAGFINYKLCRLMFALNLPRDAISQFKNHIDHFKNRMGFHELSFEHYAWLSKQFSVFGDIFDEAVKLGLPAVQTQHPGIYYQQAAQYAILRKKSCEEICGNVIAYPHPDPLMEGGNFVEFYGQRPWRPGKVSGEPPDPQLESNGIQALQFSEKQVQHSQLIVTLFGYAIAQYKTYRCPRTRRHLVLQMADEYYHSRDYGKALTLYSHMLWDFRLENWWMLMSDILDKAIRCAFLTANPQDYVTLALEILGDFSTISHDDKRKIHENLNRILKKQIPFGDHQFAPDVLQNAVIQWQGVFANESLNYALDMSNIVSCIDTRARFMRDQYEVDQKISVEIYVKNCSRFSIDFTRIGVTIASPTSTSRFGVDGHSLHFKSMEIKRFEVDFQPETIDVNREIRIASIDLTMGAANDCTLELKFPRDGCKSPHIPAELVHFKHSSDRIDFVNILPLNAATIIPRHSKLNVKIDHAIPALEGEWFQVKIVIDNEEKHKVNDFKVEVNLIDDDSTNTTEFASNSGGIPEKLPLILKTDDHLDVSGRITTSFYLRAHKVIEHNVVEIKITYTLDRKEPVISIKSENVVVPVVKPFDISTKFLSPLMQELAKFYVGEEVGVMPILRCMSPWHVVIESTSMEFVSIPIIQRVRKRLSKSSPFRSVDLNHTNQLIQKKLSNQEACSDLFFAVCDKKSDENVSLGQYVVKWRREGGLSTASHLMIIGYQCEWIPLDLKVTSPAHGFVRTPLLVAYHFYNRSQQLIQLEINMEASEAFMYAGYKQFSVSILPEKQRTIQYNLYPLIAGSVTLPKLVLTITDNCTEGPGLRQDQLKVLVDRAVPTHIYVMPQIKGNPDVTPLANARELRIQ